MTVANFETADELKQYVTDGGLVQADILTITFVRGRWYLFHF